MANSPYLRLTRSRAAPNNEPEDNLDISAVLEIPESRKTSKMGLLEAIGKMDPKDAEEAWGFLNKAELDEIKQVSRCC